jgi:hypothetical protein
VVSSNQSQSQSYVTTDGQPATLSWGLRPDFDYCLTVAGLLIWGGLSDERTGLSFAIATGPRQRNHFWVALGVPNGEHGVEQLISVVMKTSFPLNGNLCLYAMPRNRCLQ